MRGTRENELTGANKLRPKSGTEGGMGKRRQRAGRRRVGKLGRVGDCIGDCLCLLWEKERQGEIMIRGSALTTGRAGRNGER